MAHGTSRYDEAALHGRLWTPVRLLGGGLLKAWHDASDLSVNWATGVSQWTDKSGFGLHYTQGTTAQQPGLTSGGPYRSLDFTGGFRMAAAGGLPSQYDCFCVATSGPSTSGYRTLFHNGSFQNMVLFNTGTTNLGAYNSSFFGNGSSIPVSTRFMIKYSVDGSNGITHAVDGGTQSSTLTTFTPSKVAFLGNETGGSQPFGSVHETIYTDNAPTSRRTAIEGYLAWKWGIVDRLPASHPYKNRPPLIGD